MRRVLCTMFVWTLMRAEPDVSSLRAAADLWRGELPCANWDCKCAFSRPRGCCCGVQELRQLEDETLLRVLKLCNSVFQLGDDMLRLMGKMRVAFNAHLKSTTSCLGPVTRNTPISYDVITLNQGHGYNSALGVFTAPCSGLYSISLSVYSKLAAPRDRMYYKVQLMKNGEVVASMREQNREDSEDSGSQVLLLNLRPGDQVHVELLAGRELCGNVEASNTFSAFLLLPAGQ